MWGLKPSIRNWPAVFTDGCVVTTVPMNTACPHGMLLQPAYLYSPVRHVREGPGGVRQRQDLGRRGRLRFPVMDHLRAQGGTGYVAIGVHVGEVTFGNVGAPEQLGFTVIDGAANLASRLSD